MTENPKTAAGRAKPPAHYIPRAVLREVGLGMSEGGRKYGAYNWRAAGITVSDYLDAAERHLADFWEGRDIDPESGLHEVTKAITSLIVLRDALLMGNAIDDRPPPLPGPWREAMAAQARAIAARIPAPVPPVTAQDPRIAAGRGSSPAPESRPGRSDSFPFRLKCSAIFRFCARILAPLVLGDFWRMCLGLLGKLRRG